MVSLNVEAEIFLFLFLFFFITANAAKYNITQLLTIATRQSKRNSREFNTSQNIHHSLSSNNNTMLTTPHNPITKDHLKERFI
jgi:hypothetical protein